METHASHTLCIIDSVKRSSYFHIQWLFAEFFHPWCRACPDFGPFLYITTLTRSCYKYSYLRPEYEFARVADICFHFGLKQKDIKSLPVIYNIEPPRYCLADITQAKALGMQTYGSGKEVKRLYKGHLRRREENYQNRVQQWIREQRRGIHAGHSRRRSAPTSLVVDEVASWSMQVTVAFPYWDYRTQYWSQVPTAGLALITARRVRRMTRDVGRQFGIYVLPAEKPITEHSWRLIYLSIS